MKLDLDLDKQSRKENAVIHTRFEELPRKHITDDPRSRSKTVFSSVNPESSPERMESSDGSTLKRMRGHRSSDGNKSDDGLDPKKKVNLNLRREQKKLSKKT